MHKDDTAILRELAKQVRDIADSPENAAKRDLWRKHTMLQGKRPLLFISPENSWEEILPRAALQCREPLAQTLEYSLRQQLIRHTLIPDDSPIEKTVPVFRTQIAINEGWGLVPERVASSEAGGAWRYQPVVHTPSDWKKLKMPRLEVDERATQARYEAYQEAVGDLLDVFISGVKQFSFHMMHLYCDFRGLENMMMDLIDEPEMVHDVIAFFTEGFQGIIDQCERENLMALNNDGTYHYTGGLGYNDELPGADFDPGHVRPHNVWGAAEAQEFAEVSPAMHEEFILQYERKLLANFGLNGYGCCDDLTRKIENVKKIPNLRRVGICPWADMEKCADQLGKAYIMTWKPQPSYLANSVFDEAFVERYLTEELRKAKHGYVEIVLRDTHTCNKEPHRFTQFAGAARRAIQAVHGPDAEA